MKSIYMRMAGVVCGVTVSAALLGGCSAQNNQATEQQMENRQYMSQVNQTMEDLSGRLDGFSDAVARGDVVTMRTQVDDALSMLDNLSRTEAPEDLKEVQAAYVEGCDDLKAALNAYVDLYTEIESATDEQPFDYGTYDERLQEIQDQYNKGIEALQSGDSKASELQ